MVWDRPTSHWKEGPGHGTIPCPTVAATFLAQSQLSLPSYPPTAAIPSPAQYLVQKRASDLVLIPGEGGDICGQRCWEAPPRTRGHSPGRGKPFHLFSFLPLFWEANMGAWCLGLEPGR